MVWLACFTILFLTLGTSGIISQNDLAFWTLLKEYHEMELPGQGPAAGAGAEEGDAAPARAVPVAVSCAGAVAGAEAGGGPVPDDVALRLVFELTSEPVQLRVRCTHGCRWVRRPCDLHLAPGEPLRIVCYALLPDCMHYGHTSINCGVYFRKRWPEVIEALCTLDYHTSASICEAFERTGQRGEEGAESEKAFRLMLESLGVRLRPGGGESGGAPDGSEEQGSGEEAASTHDERVAWLLAASGLLAVLTGVLVVRRFKLASWTPCSWIWRDDYRIQARDSIPDCDLGKIISLNSNNPGCVPGFHMEDTLETDGTLSPMNVYKMLVVLVESATANNRKLLLPETSSFSHPDADNAPLIEMRDRNALSSASHSNYLNSSVFSTGISKSGESIHDSRMKSLENEQPSNVERDSTNKMDEVDVRGSEEESSLKIKDSPDMLDNNVKFKKENKEIYTNKSHENTVSLSEKCSTTPVLEKIRTNGSYKLGQTKNSRASKISYCTPFLKSSATLFNPAELHKSRRPALSCRKYSKKAQTTKYQERPLKSVVPQFPIPSTYPETWVCPLLLPRHPIPMTYLGSPVSLTQSRDAVNEIMEMDSNEMLLEPPSHTTTYRESFLYPTSQTLIGTDSSSKDTSYTGSTVTCQEMPSKNISENHVCAETSELIVGTGLSANETACHDPGEPTYSGHLTRSSYPYQENLSDEHAGYHVVNYVETTNASGLHIYHPVPDYVEYFQNPNDYGEQTDNHSSSEQPSEGQLHSGISANLILPSYSTMTNSQRTSEYDSNVSMQADLRSTEQVFVNTQDSTMTSIIEQSNLIMPINSKNGKHKSHEGQWNLSSQRSPLNNIFVNDRSKQPSTYRQNTTQPNHSQPPVLQGSPSQQAISFYQIPVNHLQPTCQTELYPTRVVYQPSVITPTYQPTINETATMHPFTQAHQVVGSNSQVSAYPSPMYQHAGYENDVPFQPEVTRQNLTLSNNAANVQPRVPYIPVGICQPYVKNEPVSYEPAGLDQAASFESEPTYARPSGEVTQTFQRTLLYQPSYATLPSQVISSEESYVGQPLFHSQGPFDAQYYPTFPEPSVYENAMSSSQQVFVNQMLPGRINPFNSDPCGVSLKTDTTTGYRDNRGFSQPSPYFQITGPTQIMYNKCNDEEPKHRIEPTYNRACNYPNCTIQEQNFQQIHDYPDVPASREQFTGNAIPMEPQVIATRSHNQEIYYYPVTFQPDLSNATSVPYQWPVLNPLPALDHNSQIHRGAEEYEELPISFPEQDRNAPDFQEMLPLVPVSCVGSDGNPTTSLPPVTPSGETYIPQELQPMISPESGGHAGACEWRGEPVAHCELGGGDCRPEGSSSDSAPRERQFHDQSREGPAGDCRYKCEMFGNGYADVQTTTHQFCYECSLKMGYYVACQEGSNYARECTNPIQEGENTMGKELQNEVTEQFSRISLNN